MAVFTVSISDGTTLSNLAVSAGRGPKGDGWTSVSYDNNTGRFTFTSNDGLGYVSDSITADLDTAVTDAEAAQAAAEAAQSATENIFDQFGDQYLGPKASDPTVDNDGDPLTEGDIYFNTTDDVLKFYSGTAWVAPESIATTAATAAQTAQTAAETAETNASTSASNAATSEANAATSETNAASSEANAAASEAAASTSETNAATSEANAATSETNAATSEANAATSETNAATSETNAAASEANAVTSETNAAASEANASTSEANAATSEQNAQQAATDAETALDNFTDQYLGAKSSEPSTDNDGDPLLTGSLYYNTTGEQLYVWDGSVWQDAAFSAQSTVISFNGRDGAVTLQSADVTNALGYTPQDQSTSYGSADFDTDFSGKSTDDLSEGAGNLYYTDARARAALSASGDLSYDSSTGVFSITATERALIQTPINESPADGTTGTTLTPQLEASPYRSLYGVTMVSAQWQISEVSDFATTVVDETVAGTSNTFAPSSNLSTLTNHYWRVRYTDDDGNVSDFSDATEFTTADTFVDTPTISVSGSPSNISPQPTISTSAFSVTNGSDTHVSTDWEVIETATNNVVFESANDASNLTSIDLPVGTLDTNTEYKFRARHRGSSLGASAYGEVIETTADIFTEQPTITSPTDGETNIGETPTITSSAFNTVNGSDTHVASEWEITRVSDSVVVFDSGEDTTNLTSIEVPAGVLDEGQENYTVKVRHKGATYGFSVYSPEISFTTASVFFDPEDPANIGSAYAGGYLVGIIDTVAGAIDSQDDYQTGERYALVVAPKSLETGPGPKWDSQDRTGEAGSFTRWDGLSSTDSILAKNDSSYEAFEHIRSIRSSDPVPSDGGSDWYLPAMDELELIYRNLKPVTADNSTFDSTRTFPGQQNSGFNPSSDPTGSAYTATGEPFQASVTDFQDAGAEAVDLDRYWSSTDADEGGRAWTQLFTFSGFEGRQNADTKDLTDSSVRPVRRVVL